MYNFFLGSIYLISESGSVKEVLIAAGKIQSLLHHEKEDYLLVVSEGFNMGYYAVEPDGSLQEITKVFYIEIKLPLLSCLFMLAFFFKLFFLPFPSKIRNT